MWQLISARRLKVAVAAVGASAFALVLVSMFAEDLARTFVTTPAELPIELPSGVEVRHSDRIVTLIGKGTPSGRATAVTLGSVILVPKHFGALPLEAQRNVIRHELAHVKQRNRYGRLYLPLYILLYMKHGYTEHPFEREATYQPAVATPHHRGGHKDSR